MTMLSDTALSIVCKLRDYVRSDKVGVGPDIATLVTGIDKTGAELVCALNELEQLGFVSVKRAIGSSRSGVPKELRNVVSVYVLEPLQDYLDKIVPT
jgi:hypothetical protein